MDFNRGLINLRNRSTAPGAKVVPLCDEPFAEGGSREAKDAGALAVCIEWAGVPVKSIKKGLKAAAKSCWLDEVAAYAPPFGSSVASLRTDTT